MPSISFVSDPNTGIYSPGADQLAVATNGVARLSISSAGEVTTANEKLNLITVGRGPGAISSNTAVGFQSLLLNTTGNHNTAIGRETLLFNTIGSYNTANGFQALISNDSGSYNTAIGHLTISTLTTGSNNTAIGHQAFLIGNGSSNTCLGYSAGSALSTGSNNTIIGSIVGTAGLADTVIIAAGATERLRITSTNTLNFVGAGTAGSTQTVSLSGSAPINSLVLDSSGRLGIGTSSPTEKLTIDGNVAFNTNDQYIKFNSFYGSPYTGSMGSILAFNSAYGSEVAAINFYQTGGNVADILFRTGLAGSSVERMRINSSGNVGIGTTVANSKLSIGNGASTNDGLTITFTGDNSTLARFYANTSTGEVSIGGIAATYFSTFYAAGSEKARIRTDGMFEVKGAGVSGSSPAFSVNGSAPANSAIIDTSGRLLVGTTNDAGSSSNRIVVGSNGICGVKKTFTNLDTTPQSFGFQANNASVYVAHLQSVSTSSVAFLIACVYDTAVGIVMATTALGRCTAGGTAATISGINGDARTYTFQRDAGTGEFTVTASAVATGSTVIALTPLNQYL